MTSLIVNERWRVPIPRSSRLVNIYRLIPKILIDKSIDEDKNYWEPGPSGNFSIASVYNCLLRWNPVPWAAVVWFKGGIPRFLVITWMLCLQRLSTLDRLYKWVITTNRTCALCKEKNEDILHLFFVCPTPLLRPEVL